MIFKLGEILEILKKVRALLMSVFGFDENKNKVEVPKTDEVPSKTEFDECICDTGWIELVAVGDYDNYSVNNRPIRYRKKNGVVYVNGAIGSLTADSDGALDTGTMATLPSDCRPTHSNMWFPTVGYNNDFTGAIPLDVCITKTGAVSVGCKNSSITSEVNNIYINFSYPV